MATQTIKKKASPAHVIGGNWYTSTDYEKFFFIKGNRDVNALHLKKIERSMSTRALLSIVLVNESMQIIDGQHRFLALMALGLPINYIIVDGYGLEEVQILNIHQVNWKSADYLKGYCDLGYPQYMRMSKFMMDYPEFGMSSTLKILTLLTNGVKSEIIKGFKSRSSDDFQKGNFDIPDLNKSISIANNLRLLAPYFPEYTDPTFVACMLPLFSKKEYVHSEFVKKLSVCGTKFLTKRNVLQYRAQIEEVYNYRRKEKVNLRII